MIVLAKDGFFSLYQGNIIMQENIMQNNNNNNNKIRSKFIWPKKAIGLW